MAEALWCLSVVIIQLDGGSVGGGSLDNLNQIVKTWWTFTTDVKVWLTSPPVALSFQSRVTTVNIICFLQRCACALGMHPTADYTVSYICIYLKYAFITAHIRNHFDSCAVVAINRWRVVRMFFKLVVFLIFLPKRFEGCVNYGRKWSCANFETPNALKSEKCCFLCLLVCFFNYTPILANVLKKLEKWQQKTTNLWHALQKHRAEHFRIN